MRSLAVDDKGNLLIGSDFKLVDNINSLIQDIKTRLRLVEGEYHFDVEAGMPYFELLQNNNKKTFENEVLNEVLKDNRVKTAKITNSDLKNGKLTLNIEVLTNEGNLIII